MKLKRSNARGEHPFVKQLHPDPVLPGSVLRDDFNAQSSDVDVLVDFAPEALDGIGLAYLGGADDLAQIVGRRVDFCSRLHPRIEPLVRKEALIVFEAA